MVRRLVQAVQDAVKSAVGYALALLWLRPLRERRALKLLSTATDVFVVRIDNRVGEALLTTPLIAALAAKYRVHAVVHERCARVLEGLPGLHALHPVSRRDALLGPLSARTRQLRSLASGAIVVSAADTGIYSGTQALFARAVAGRAVLVGPGAGPAAVLADLAVPVEVADRGPETQRRLKLLSPLGIHGVPRLSFRTPAPSPEVRAFRQALTGRLAVVNPGGRLGERRVPPEVFERAARSLEALGLTAVTTWGPGEEPLAAVVKGVVAPKTNLDDLAYLMAESAVVVCNNTGPMHLAVAVGAPTLALFFKMPMERWGHAHPPHQMLDLTAHAGDPKAMQQAAVSAVEAFVRASGGDLIASRQ